MREEPLDYSEDVVGKLVQDHSFDHHIPPRIFEGLFDDEGNGCDYRLIGCSFVYSLSDLDNDVFPFPLLAPKPD